MHETRLDEFSLGPDRTGELAGDDQLLSGQELSELAGADAPVDTEEASPSEHQSRSDTDPARLRAELEDQKRRNAGLQRRLQRELQERQELERRLAQYEEAIYQQQLAILPPEERLARLEAFRRERAVRDRERQAQLVDQALEERARRLVIAELSRTYNVPVEDLERFNDPDSMEFYAKRVAELRLQGEARARRAAGSDRFEPAEPTPGPRKRARDLDEAAELFREAIRRRYGQL